MMRILVLGFASYFRALFCFDIFDLKNKNTIYKYPLKVCNKRHASLYLIHPSLIVPPPEFPPCWRWCWNRITYCSDRRGKIKNMLQIVLGNKSGQIFRQRNFFGFFRDRSIFFHPQNDSRKNPVFRAHLMETFVVQLCRNHGFEWSCSPSPSSQEKRNVFPQFATQLFNFLVGI